MSHAGRCLCCHTGIRVGQTRCPRCGQPVTGRPLSILESKGDAKMITGGMPEPGPIIRSLELATAQREAVPGMPSEGPYPASVEEVAQEVVDWITRTEKVAPGLGESVAQLLLRPTGQRVAEHAIRTALEPNEAQPRTWGELVEGDQAQGGDGQFYPVVASQAVTDPHSHQAAAKVTLAVGTEERTYLFKPDAEVQVIRGPAGLAMDELAKVGVRPEVIRSWSR